MKVKNPLFIAFIIGLILVMLVSCGAQKKTRVLENFSYTAFKDSMLAVRDTAYQAENIFDDTTFIPEIDSLDTMLLDLGQMWRNHLFQGNDRMEVGETEAEKGVARVNLVALDSFLEYRHVVKPATCRETNCVLFADVDKTRQLLFLYIDGELVDSFKTSTGMRGKYETRNFSVRPSGPIFTRYTSRKFPGGNYMGLGNMPYAVFVKGGYAIHGTTSGNFSKLGKRASHGCIRLHPDNGKIFNELVKRVGLENTWVRVRD
jgi:hypothetical protein